MGQPGEKILVIAPPSQDKKGVVFQIKHPLHLREHIIGPVPLPVLREIGQG